MEKVRVAERADVPGLVPLVQHLSCLIWNGDEQALAKSLAAFVNSPTARIYVIGPVGKPLAAAVVYIQALVGTPQNQWLIDDLVVGPDARGQGLGGRLVEGILAEAQAERAAQVSGRVDPSEPAGARTYLSRGFSPGDHLVVWTP